MYNTKQYILVGKKVKLEKSLVKWGEWMQSSNRTVDYTYLTESKTKISTVFLGLDHNHRGKGKPILFETIVFCTGKYSHYMKRYSTFEQAETGHKEIVKMIEDGKDITD